MLDQFALGRCKTRDETGQIISRGEAVANEKRRKRFSTTGSLRHEYSSNAEGLPPI